MIVGQELEMALGMPVYITSFSDKLPRKCYPFTLENLHDANMALSSFDNKSLEANMGNEYNMVALSVVLQKCFRDEDQIEIWNGIDEKSFPEIISDIKEVSGIKDGDKEIDVKQSMESLSWGKSISAIQVYTSNTIQDIREMTLRVFNNLLSEVGQSINWEYKTGIVTNVKDPDKFIKPDEHPLSPDRVNVNKTRMTMKDIEGLKNMKR